MRDYREDLGEDDDGTDADSCTTQQMAAHESKTGDEGA
jgi:hypothetical protein